MYFGIIHVPLYNLLCEQYNLWNYPFPLYNFLCDHFNITCTLELSMFHCTNCVNIIINITSTLELSKFHCTFCCVSNVVYSIHIYLHLFYFSGVHYKSSYTTDKNSVSTRLIRAKGATHLSSNIFEPSKSI